MLNNYFKIKESGSTIRTEVYAGLTTFLTMAYVLALIPGMLSMTGMDGSALFTSVAVASIVGTLVMALWAKLPFVLAPGVGLTAFFAFTVCLTMGYSWQFALTAVFIEGLIFILLTVFNVREVIVDAIPEVLKNAIGAGIGFFIAFIGLQKSGIIVNSDSTLVTLGEITSGNGALVLFGLFVTTFLLIKRVPGALLLGILLVAALSMLFGLSEYKGVVGLPPSMEPIMFKFDFSEVFSMKMVIVVFTFLFVDLFDTLGTLVGVSIKANMLTPEGKVPNIKKAFMADALGTTVGAMLGTSTVTTYVESAAGVSQGGRTGLTALVAAGCFGLSLFMAPLFLSMGVVATAPALILVGLFMITPIKNIDFNDFTQALPAFICIIMMPLSYSIADGISLGMISYVFLNFIGGNQKKLTIGMYVLFVLFIIKYFL